jgi:hypothetical protein
VLFPHGLPRFPPRTNWQWAVVSAVFALVGQLLYAGFSVDDAWIIARMAHHVGIGVGYRFNATGPLVDAVTPLGWPYLLAPLGWFGVQTAYTGARLLGSAAWVVAAGRLGWELAGSKAAWWPLVAFALVPTLGAWPSAGMETGVIMALVVFGVASKPGFGLCLGLAGAFRPELLPFAAAVGLGRAVENGGWRRLPGLLALTLGPAFLFALIRWFVFGSPVPLSSIAKPAELGSGIRYSLGALLLSGPFWLWLGPGWRDLPRPLRTHVVAVGIHLLAMALAGGDWMAMYRLLAPVLPLVAQVACHLMVCGKARYHVPGVLLSLVSTAMVAVGVGIPGRRIVAQREAVMEQGKSLLSGARVVAALDVGWVGAVSPGEIVDLAGVTDPGIAAVPGGHTTKRFPESLPWVRHMDTMVLLLAPGEELKPSLHLSRFAREVESRLARVLGDEECRPIGSIPLAFTTQRYAVLRCDLR